jgi:hypothetical protein
MTMTTTTTTTCHGLMIGTNLPPQNGFFNSCWTLSTRVSTRRLCGRLSLGRKLRLARRKLTWDQKRKMNQESRSKRLNVIDTDTDTDKGFNWLPVCCTYSEPLTINC